MCVLVYKKRIVKKNILFLLLLRRITEIDFPSPPLFFPFPSSSFFFTK